MKLREKNPALLLIDVQQAFLDDAYWGGNRNNKDAEEVCGQLLRQWRILRLPFFHVRHSSANPASRLHATSPGFAFHEAVQPLEGERVITKSVNSAFIGTQLDDLLKKEGITTLVIAGITTNHCVSTTTRMAGNMGYDTFVISDATAAFDRIGVQGEKYGADLIHWTALANLNEEFATVWDSTELLRQL